MSHSDEALTENSSDDNMNTVIAVCAFSDSLYYKFECNKYQRRKIWKTHPTLANQLFKWQFHTMFYNHRPFRSQQHANNQNVHSNNQQKAPSKHVLNHFNRYVVRG